MVYEDDDVLLVDFGHGGQFKRSPFNYAGDITKQILCANTREECTCVCAQTYVPLKLKRIAKKKRKMNQMYGNTVNSLLNHMVNTRLNQDVSYCGKRFYMKYMHFGLGGWFALAICLNSTCININPIHTITFSSIFAFNLLLIYTKGTFKANRLVPIK